MLRRSVVTAASRWARLPVLRRAPQRNVSHFCVKIPAVPCCYWSTLPNGIRVISEQTTSELACVAVFCEAGPRYELPAYNGASHLVEHMAYKGFTSLYKIGLENAISSMGAKLTVHTDKEYQVFSAVCPNACVETIINIFAKVFCQLQFEYFELENAKKVIAEELAEEEADPRALAFYLLHKTAFQGTPLAQPVIGSLDNYRCMDRGFLVSFLSQQYQPCGMVLSVSSSHSHNCIVCMAQADFGCYVRNNLEEPTWPCRYTGSEARYRNDDMPFAYVAFAVEAPGYNSPDYLYIQLMKHILGRWSFTQAQGYNTWPMLAHACEISKLAVHYETFYLPYKDVGLFGVYLIMPKEQDMSDTLLMVQDQWMKLCFTIVQADVDRAAASLKMELAKKTTGCVASCHDMGLQMLYKGSRLTLVEMFRDINNMKELEVRDKAPRFLYDFCHSIGSVGPDESILNYVRTRAGMYWLRI